MKAFVVRLLFPYIGAIFTSSRPPWSCMLSPPRPLQFCLNPRSYESLILYDTGGTIIGAGISGAVKSFSGFGPFPQLAVKTFAAPNDPESSQSFVSSTPQECLVAERLKHPNMVMTYDIIFDGEYWHQIMEYVPFRLQELLSVGCLSPEQIDSIFARVVEATAYMRALGVAHLDLKLGNIMVTEQGVPKLIDFGSSYVFGVNGSQNTSQARLLAGMSLSTNIHRSEYDKFTDIPCQVNMELSLYSAPEVLSGLSYDLRLVDVWALGIMYVCMVARCPWMQARYDDESFNDFVSQGPSTLLKLLPERSRSMIEKMLAIKPDKRTTMAQLLLGLPEGLARDITEVDDTIRNDGLIRGGSEALLFGYRFLV